MRDLNEENQCKPLALKQTNFVLSFVILLCGICAIEGNLFHCLETVLPKATKYTKWGAFTFITVKSFPLVSEVAQ